MCNSGITQNTLIPLYVRNSEESGAPSVPPRPAAQRAPPVQNEDFNPFRNLGQEFGFDGQGEGVRVRAGFGFFPPLAILLGTCQFDNGESGHAPLDVVSPKFQRAVLSLTVLLILVVSLI